MIEDNDADARLVRELLQERASNLNVHREKKLKSGLKRLAADSFDLVLLDLGLPDSTGGLGTLREVIEGSHEMPIVVITGLEDKELAASAIRYGAEDYLIKSDLNTHLLSRSIDYAIERHEYNAALRASEGRIRNYAKRLSFLHEIGLTLNQETDSYRLLKSVLKSAAEMTSAGTGVMLTVNNSTELVSIYYAPWYESRCQSAENVSTLHQRIGRLMPDKTANAFRITDFLSSAERGLPGGHPPLRGLLIGRLSDMLGRTKGYFLLSDKESGMDFTREDEEIVSLLASQSSVALVSAEILTREHEVADVLQESLLPDVPHHDKLDIGLIYQSASSPGAIGGDFYDFVELAGDQVAFSIGDVCGKGLKAAKYTAMVKYTLRAYLETGRAPGDCLDRLNSVVMKNITPDKFITAALVILDIRKKSMSFALAGHPEPILSSTSGMRGMSAPRTLPLGVVADYSFPTERLSITDDTTLLMYTDGLIEAHSGDGEQFGFKRLQSALESRRCLPAQTIAKNLVERVVDFSGNMLQDDVAVVVVRSRLAT